MNTLNKKLIMATAVLTAVCAVLCIFIINTHSTDTTARIYQDGKVIYTIDLDNVTQAYQIRVEGRHGAYNIIDVQPGKIGVCEASCPDKICVKTGYISDGIMPVTCLPNKLVIVIEGGHR
ncbi:MAG: NusG domain II-containing protein [Oscillospiraceae bacterium]|nr:NusG domain II-containing protein [Oscillospiraceae bacterium]